MLPLSEIVALATTVDDEITNLGLRDLTFSGRKFRNQIAGFFDNDGYEI